MDLDFIEPQARIFWRLLNHGQDYSDLRCIDVNEGTLLSRVLVIGEDAVVRWAATWNGRGNCFIGRNPRNADGTVREISTFSFDIDPIRPARTAANDSEHERALLAGRIVLQKYPGGYLLSSGNGSLVIYRLASHRSDGFEDFEGALSTCEKQIQWLLDSRGLNDIKCDHTFDTPRIVKLPGSASTKGDRALWRLSRFIDVPSLPYRVVADLPRVSEPERGKGLQQRRVSEVVPQHAQHAQDYAVALRCKGKGFGAAAALEAIGRGWIRPVEIGTLDGKLQLASGALARLAPERREDYQSWLSVGLALRELGPIGFQLWDSWSRGSDKYDQEICVDKWQTFQGEPRIGVGSIEHWAREDQRRTVAKIYGTAPEVSTTNGSSGILEIRTLADRATEYFQTLTTRREQGRIGIATGFSVLDRLLGGCRAGEFIVVASRTGLGKTSFICTVSGGLAAAGTKVALFCTEMDWQAITSRVVAAHYGIPASDVERGRLQDQGLKSAIAFTQGPGANFLLDDDPSATIEYVRRVCLSWKPDVVIYDHVQRAGTDPSNSRQQISGFVKQFKNLMRETGATGILLSQIRRLGKDAKGRFFEPALSDLKESGTIEEEAGAVMLLHWPVEKPEGRYVQVVANLAKNRFGQTDYFELVFDRETTRFLEKVPQ